MVHHRLQPSQRESSGATAARYGLIVYLANAHSVMGEQLVSLELKNMLRLGRFALLAKAYRVTRVSGPTSCLHVCIERHIAMSV